MNPYQLSHNAIPTIVSRFFCALSSVKTHFLLQKWIGLDRAACVLIYDYTDFVISDFSPK